jgi:hypothetical protein
MRIQGRTDTAALEKETTNRLVQWLKTHPVPENKNGTCLGDYDSWLLTYLFLRESGTAVSADVRQELAEKFTRVNCTNKPSAYDFTDPANLSAILRQEKRSPSPLDVSALEPVSGKTAHHVGAVISSHWPSTKEFDSKTCADYSRFLTTLMPATDLWRDDFGTVTHWIPQFIWFGIWRELGEP